MDVKKLSEYAEPCGQYFFMESGRFFLKDNLSQFNKNLKEISISPWIFIQSIFEQLKYFDDQSFKKASFEINNKYFRTGSIGLDEVADAFKKYECKFENGNIKLFLEKQWAKCNDLLPFCMPWFDLGRFS